MRYECYDKNGNYLGNTFSKIEANEKITRANAEIMRREGVNPLLITLYQEKQRQEREKEAARQKRGGKIFFDISDNNHYMVIGSMLELT